ncbi:MAG: glutamyl-tRNA reductase [Clostridia bacterium]|jgi:glutamyl-tRNA reductase|nr:glutamyl-tRNA reductase [Clostridia bacterium]MDN5323463.1 glutamyl-tRNA reductase [Clostridia bacterium]
MFVIVLGLNHKTAPVEIREKISMSKPQMKNKARELSNLDGVEGIVILSTCNRTEFYIATKDVKLGKKSLINFVANYGNCPVPTLERFIYLKECRNAVHHLFRVASGLDSMILGETQILGQVQDAYEYALEYKLSNNVLNTLFQNAISVGKRVRTETQIDRHAVSVSSAAVELAKQIFGNLNGCCVLILGAGETSELTARHLVANGVSTVIVANRTFERACKLAQEFGGNAIRLDDFPEHLITADIIISCTAAPKYIVEAKDLLPVLEKRKGRHILFIDIAVPRDINPDVLQLDNVSLYDVDDLQNVVQQNIEERKKEAVKAELIINDELNKFFKWLDSLFVIPTIVALKEKGNYIKKKELERTLRKLNYLSEKEKRIIESLANGIINQLLHNPISNLKEYAHGQKGAVYAEAIQKLFDLDKNGQEVNEEGMV